MIAAKFDCGLRDRAHRDGRPTASRHHVATLCLTASGAIAAGRGEILAQHSLKP
jgi:hypothetical protein